MAVGTGRPRLLLPGLLPADLSRERYRVRPGGVTVLALSAGDRLTVTDLDGGQRAEITAVSPEGGADPGALGFHADAPATVLGSLVRSEADGARDVIQALAATGLDPSAVTAGLLFGEWSAPGSSQSFLAQREVVCAVAAPTGSPVVEGGVPPSDLVVEVRRA